jgi:ribosomal protein S18 acetylase RimI-like enzyme
VIVLRLRPATASDVAAIRAIVDRAYGVYVERIGMRPGPMDDDYDERVASAEVTVAELDGAIVGYVVLVPGADDVLVENVAVDPSRQGLGIGGALLDLADRRARDLGVDRVRLYTHEAMAENLALYARRGFVVDERRQEDGFARVFLSKRISG